MSERAWVPGRPLSRWCEISGCDRFHTLVMPLYVCGRIIAGTGRKYFTDSCFTTCYCDFDFQRWKHDWAPNLRLSSEVPLWVPGEEKKKVGFAMDDAEMHSIVGFKETTTSLCLDGPFLIRKIPYKMGWTVRIGTIVLLSINIPYNPSGLITGRGSEFVILSLICRHSSHGTERS